MGSYQFGALVTSISCDSINVTTPSDKVPRFLPGRHWFTVGGLVVPVPALIDAPALGTTARITIEWGE